MLESLCKGTATIHELNLAGAFPERAPYRPRELYAALQATPLFDAERGQWNFRMSGAQIVEATFRASYVLLLEVLVEAQLDPKKARELYEQLKTTPLYDPKLRQWNCTMSEEQELESTCRYAAPQLLGVLVEAQFDPENAQAQYARLKGTPLYDSTCGQWREWMTGKQVLGSSIRHAAAQLLGVLVEAQCNKEAAPVLYEKVKATPLYDSERGQWNQAIYKEQIWAITDRFAAAQLLGVLAEAQFDGESARVRYEKLKATPLYDPERRQWNYRMSAAQGLQDTDRVAVVQLLGVLVEGKLLSTLPRALAETVPPLPVMENW